ncbi:MAG: hypothetical protein GF341_09780 [candidate division Zixibacteria bacterium]|nr:hypothetical protein [candidate division Zixibacteria bacterium]
MDYYYEWTIPNQDSDHEGASKATDAFAQHGSNTVSSNEPPRLIPCRKLVDLLSERSTAILRSAELELKRSHLRRYEATPSNEVRTCLELFYLEVLSSVRRCKLDPILDYVRQIARDRYRNGYEIREVQVAIRSLEVAMWNCVSKRIGTGSISQALGVVSTVFGMAKDVLAQSYIVLIRDDRETVADRQRLFDGSASLGTRDAAEAS